MGGVDGGFFSVGDLIEALLGASELVVGELPVLVEGLELVAGGGGEGWRWSCKGMLMMHAAKTQIRVEHPPRTSAGPWLYTPKSAK